MTKYILAAWLIIIAVLTAPAFAGNCHHIFAHKQVAVVQPVVVHQTILYSVGESLIRDAAIELRVREEVRKELSRHQQQQQAPQQQQQPTAPVSVLSAKCARCHTGETAKGGIDFTRAIDAITFRRSVELMGTGKDAPKEMAAVLAGLTPEQKGSLMEELLNLSNPLIKSEPEQGKLE